MSLIDAPSSILLVEDNPDDSHLAMIEFEDAGVTNEVILLEDGEQAVQYLRRRPPFVEAARPGLVLLDLHLPRLDGHEVLQDIESEPGLRSIPIIVVSVPTELTWVQEEYGHVIAGVLPKPILIDPLCEVLDRIEHLGAGFLRRS
jgi:CheY-like chemotaxis protein